MTYRNFEHYLSFIHAERNPELLDDDLPDAFGEWMDTLSVDEWIEFADKYASHAVAERTEEIRKQIAELLKADDGLPIDEALNDYGRGYKKGIEVGIAMVLSSLTPPTTEEKENL